MKDFKSENADLKRVIAALIIQFSENEGVDGEDPHVKIHRRTINDLRTESGYHPSNFEIESLEDFATNSIILRLIRK